MEHEECLRQLITLFLELNCEPSDAQVHALAEALGEDKETLEAQIYEMLGEELSDEDAEGEYEVHADSQDVLEGLISPDVLPLDDIALNDGDPTAEDTGFQQETTDDGADVHDMGVGMTSGDGEDVLQDDGVPEPVEL